MKVEKFDLEGLMLVEPKVFKDPRGFFTERYREDQFSEIGIKTKFIQDNFSRSDSKTLRGLHFQYDKPQSKLVTCTRGKILDVVVDIRKKSKTFGRSVQIVLEGDNPKWFWIPAGFAHGFSVLSDSGADVLYKVDALYNPKGEMGIMWNDRDLNINWNTANPIISDRDQKGMSFSDYARDAKF